MLIDTPDGRSLQVVDSGGDGLPCPWGFAVEAVTVPVSVWAGEQDNVVPLSHGRWLAELSGRG